MVRLQDVSCQHNQGQLYENKATPPSPPNITTNIQTCAASIQVYYVANAGEINNILCETVAPIQLQVIRTDDPMVVLQSKGTQQSSRNMFLGAAAYDAVKKNSHPYSRYE